MHLGGACGRQETRPGCSLYSIKQHQDEPRALYAEKLKGLARRYITDKRLLDEFCLDYLVAGARNSVKKCLEFSKPSSLQLAVEIRQDVEEQGERNTNSAQRKTEWLNMISTAGKGKRQAGH